MVSGLLTGFITELIKGIFCMADFDHFTRRRLLGLAGITLAGLSLPRLGFAADEHAGHNTSPEPAGTGEFIRLDAPRKLKLAVNLNAVCLAPVVIAHGQGFFTKHNLDVELVNFGNSTEVLLEAIATGKADAGVGMALRWLKALEQGFDVSSPPVPMAAACVCSVPRTAA